MTEYDDSLLPTSELDDRLASLQQSDWPAQATELLWEGVQRCRGPEAEQRAAVIVGRLKPDAVTRLLARELGIRALPDSHVLAVQLGDRGLGVASGWRVALADGTQLHELLGESDADDPAVRLSRLALLGMMLLKMRSRLLDVPSF
jgi:hypothetical protein